MSAYREDSGTRWIALGMFIGMAISACTAPGDAAKEEAQPAISASGGDVSPLDDRTPIFVDAGTRAAVLREMRTMLNAVQGIVWGAVQGDTAALRFAAVSAGLAAASEAEEGVAAQLGPAFVQLGMRTHASFDSLAADVAQGKSRDVVLRRLSTVMGNCVGCHNQFRLVVQP